MDKPNMLDQSFRAVFSFILGTSLVNIDLSSIFEKANPVIDFIGNIAGVAFVILSIFYIIESTKLKREEKEKVERENRLAERENKPHRERK